MNRAYSALLKLVFLAFAVFPFAGCQSAKEALVKEFVDPFRDVITPGLPRLAAALPPEAKIFIARPLGAATQGVYARNGMTLVSALEQELKRHGATVSVGKLATANYDLAVSDAKAAGAKYLLVLIIQRWEYGSAGWSGRGNRDEVQFDAMLVDAERKRVLCRHSIEVTNGVLRSSAGGESSERAVAPVIRRYVNSLYKL